MKQFNFICLHGDVNVITIHRGSFKYVKSLKIGLDLIEKIINVNKYK
jgi:hypothetical protein